MEALDQPLGSEELCFAELGFFCWLFAIGTEQGRHPI
jgi:hypothetical protein